jgi:hypothetical protein
VDLEGEIKTMIAPAAGGQACVRLLAPDPGLMQAKLMQIGRGGVGLVGAPI